MHGFGGGGGENWKQLRLRHMLRFPTTVAVSNLSSPLHFFLKDGRKICVGDCALFKPPQDSLPFIGIIRKLPADEEEIQSFGVNWLYRPSDVKLAKGASLEAAPNEVFYSFHKDEIPAASLLHPCKVAFLCKGVELPPGIPSFVCRRVYDIRNKCLWWLTDKDYVNERQEEVDKLLNKTRLEMHGAVPSGGRSPKPLVSASTAQIKPSSDSVHNSSSFSSHVKGKKRERVDHSSDPIKRERLSRPEDGESGQSRVEHMLKAESVKITDKGGLVDIEGVEKLVQLMQSDSSDKKLDLAGRKMLVDVIAVTDRIDCLGWFVQFRGLLVLDEWIQEAHKGKIGDGNSLKESEKSVDDFLLVLLRALNKLPVNLHALQTCNVGKSVNHLRTHKNSEIQKKARSLVDTWKKRVEAEMNMNDVGSNRGVSWPTKPASSEVSHVGNRKACVSVGGGTRTSTTQSSGSKIKLGVGETAAKLSASTGSMKLENSSAAGNSKDPNFRMLVGSGSTDLPLAPIKEERSSSSSQSQNNSQSCSSDHARTVGSSCREDARSSTAGSVTVSKSSSGASRHRKSSNGVHGSAISGGQKETCSGKTGSSNRNMQTEITPMPIVQCDKLSDMSIADHGNVHRLIVKLPNTYHNPGGASGCPIEDSTVMSGRTSPSAEKHDGNERIVTPKTEALRSSIVSSGNSDLCQGKDGSGGFDEGIVSTACDEQQQASEDDQKITKVSEASGYLSGIIPRSGKKYDNTSLSSMNALVESCVKFSEAIGSAPLEDDVGMNLLASVAAGEILRSNNNSPAASPQRNKSIAEESCSGNDGNLRHTGEEMPQVQCQPNEGAGVSATELCNIVDSLQSENEFSHNAIQMLENFTGDNKATSVGFDEKKGESSAVLISSSNLPQSPEVPGFRSDMKPEEVRCDASLAPLFSNAKNENHSEVEGVNPSCEHRKLGAQKGRDSNIYDSKSQTKALVSDYDKKIAHGDQRTFESKTTVEPKINAKSDEVEKEANKGSDNLVEQTLSMKDVCEDSLERKSEHTSIPSVFDNNLHVAPKVETLPDTNAIFHSEPDTRRPSVGSVSSVLDHNGEYGKDNLETEKAPPASVSHVESPEIPTQEKKSCEKPSEVKLDAVESERIEERHVSSADSSVSIAGSSMALKLDFDLNEGIPLDDGSQGEPMKSASPRVSSVVHLPCPLPISLSSTTGCFSTSITVTAAAKGSFVPPENSMRIKGELGWKGSAATSAFRPAEPRKNLDMPASAGDIPSVDTAASKHGRPPLDFDLNVIDERVLEDVAFQSGARASGSESRPRDRGAGVLDLDLNRPDEGPDTGMYSACNSSRFGVSEVPSRPSLPGGLSNGCLNVSRDFDLNNGPSIDELGSETAPQSVPMKISLPFPSPVAGVRMNGAEFGSFPSWFPPSNSYSAITVPSVFPSRGEQGYVAAAGSQRILASNFSTSFGPDMYRGPVLSSSPAVPFPPAVTPFPYPGFAFENSFPLSSNAFSGASTSHVDSSSVGPFCFPAVPSQLVGSAGVVSSPYRPYVMSITGGPSNGSNVGSDNRKWGGPLDLNAGHGGSDTERRDDRLLSSSTRQIPVSVSQSLAEEQWKLYQSAGRVASGVFKRKEPDGG